MRERFDRLLDNGRSDVAGVAPIDVLGYGAISEDLDAGRLGLIRAPAIAFAVPPAKVTAMTDEKAREMSVAMNVMGPRDRGQQRSGDFVALLIPWS